MTLRSLVCKIAPDITVFIMKEGCTDPSTFKRLSGHEALKEYTGSNVEVKDFRFDSNILFITI